MTDEFKPWHFNGNPVIDRYHIGKGRLASTQDKGTVAELTSVRISNFKNQYIDLYVNSFSMDMNISGTTAQSVDYREFYPRAMTDIVFTVQGQVANDKEYNRISEFVHETQIRALHGTGSTLGDPTVRLSVIDNSYTTDTDGARAGRSRSHGFSSWLMHGYIKSIRAGAKRFNVAPSYSFDFVMSYSSQDADTTLNSIFKGSLVNAKANSILGWMEIVREEGYGYHPTNNAGITTDDSQGNVVGGNVNRTSTKVSSTQTTVDEVVESVDSAITNALDNLLP